MQALLRRVLHTRAIVQVPFAQERVFPTITAITIELTLNGELDYAKYNVDPDCAT